ncbi:hypothetical protein AGMMS50233_10200 [Endomicrobiia bacterium]|nr:hypothetical protein AGMMS50233_10200 [Endomicrobiia bacterium]
MENLKNQRFIKIYDRGMLFIHNTSLNINHNFGNNWANRKDLTSFLTKLITVKLKDLTIHKQSFKGYLKLSGAVMEMLKVILDFMQDHGS